MNKPTLVLKNDRVKGALVAMVKRLTLNELNDAPLTLEAERARRYTDAA